MVGQLYVWILYRYPCRYYNWIFNVGMMKKLLLLVLLTIGYMAGAQETIQSVEAQIGVKRNQSKDWKWKQLVPCQVVFTLDNAVITTNDRDESVYTTYETVQVTNRMGVWKAHDNRGKECIIRMEYTYPKGKIEVEYKSICYRYFFNN